MNEPLQKSAEVQPEASSNHAFRTIAAVASLIKDLGVIFGIPVVVTVGLKLYDIQEKSYEAQFKVTEAQIKVLEAQNNLLKETQYDRALAIIKGQREIFDMERAKLEQKIADLQKAGDSSEELQRQLAEILVLQGALKRAEESVRESLDIKLPGQLPEDYEMWMPPMQKH